MKKYFLFLAMGCIIASCSNQTKSNSSKDEDSGNTEHVILAEEVKTLVLDVRGMTCTGCETTVKKSISSLAGVTEATASHLDSVAIVSFDPGQTSVEEIENAVASVGYTVAGFKFKDAGGTPPPDKE